MDCSYEVKSLLDIIAMWENPCFHHLKIRIFPHCSSSRDFPSYSYHNLFFHYLFIIETHNFYSNSLNFLLEHSYKIHCCCCDCCIRVSIQLRSKLSWGRGTGTIPCFLWSQIVEKHALSKRYHGVFLSCKGAWPIAIIYISCYLKY